MSNQPSNEASKSETRRFGCAIAAVLLFGASILVIASVWHFVNSAFTDFDSYRDNMCLRNDLIVANENLRYSPGMDAIMWCKFTAEANDLDDVFDSTKVNTSEFNETGYKFRLTSSINDQWWDVDGRNLIGGEVQVGNDFMRVAYVDNGDGTFTVYIFWFEV